MVARGLLSWWLPTFGLSSSTSSAASGHAGLVPQASMSSLPIHSIVDTAFGASSHPTSRNLPLSSAAARTVSGLMPA